MSSQLVTISRFTSFPEAQQALALLGDVGIEATLSGDHFNNTFGGIGSLGAYVELLVATDDEEQAREILSELENRRTPTPDWEDEAQQDDEIWVCTLCGGAVDSSLPTCPDCATSRESIKQSVSSVTREPPPSPRPSNTENVQKPTPLTPNAPVRVRAPLRGELEFPEIDTFMGDDLARRALTAALAGLFVPLMPLYALWLQFRLAAFTGRLSKKGLRDQFWGFVFIVVGLALFLPFLLLLFRVYLQ